MKLFASYVVDRFPKIGEYLVVVHKSRFYKFSEVYTITGKGKRDDGFYEYEGSRTYTSKDNVYRGFATLTLGIGKVDSYETTIVKDKKDIEKVMVLMRL